MSSFHRNHRAELVIEKVAVVGLPMMILAVLSAADRGSRFASPYRWSKFRQLLALAGAWHSRPFRAWDGFVGLATGVSSAGGAVVTVSVATAQPFVLAVLGSPSLPE